MTIDLNKPGIPDNSPDFRNNYSDYQKILEYFRANLEKVSSHGSTDAKEKHISRGKLLARDRINLLLDEKTPFLEFSSFAAFDQYNNSFPSAGIITGIGLVNGRECLIIANDATVKGGTYIRETIKKHVRAQEIARQNKLICIYLVDSGGIYLPEQENVFPDRFDFGRVFYNQARMSAEGIPQISVVMGSCTAGGAYVPAMSDETIMVKNQATIFIGGPPLVKAATGEDITPEELGGADVHTRISGVADHIANDDLDALKICREIVSGLPIQQKQKTEITKTEEPLFAADEIYGYIPIDLKKPINVKAIIERLVDGSKFREFKAEYGKTLITGFARIYGYQIGIIANNSFLTSESSLKGAHFIQLCVQRKIPVLFLQNITGFIVGKKYEHNGIARDGAKLINAVANASVPKFTVIIGGSFGAGNYAMSGRAFDPNFLFMWPHARISVMGGEQASGVLRNIGNNSNSEKLLESFDKQSSAYYSSSRIWDDGIIDPADTRKILAMAISVSLNGDFDEPNYGVFRM